MTNGERGRASIGTRWAGFTKRDTSATGGKGEVGRIHRGGSRGVKAALRGDVRSVDRRVVPNELIRRWTQIYADGERRTVLNLRESASSADASSLAQLVGLFRWQRFRGVALANHLDLAVTDELCDNARAAASKRVTNALVEHLEGHCPILVAAEDHKRPDVLLTYLLRPRSDDDDCTETQIVFIVGHRSRGRKETGVGITGLVTVAFGRRPDVAKDTLRHHGLPFAARIFVAVSGKLENPKRRVNAHWRFDVRCWTASV